MSESPTYEVWMYVVVPMATVYFGLFVMVSNNYVFKPKVEQLLSRSPFESKAFSTVVICALSNLPALSLFCFSVLPSGSEKSINTALVSDLIWCGGYLAYLAYQSYPPNEKPNPTITLKNGLFMIVCYASITYHFLSQQYLFSLGITLLGIYFISLVVASYQQKILSIVEGTLSQEETIFQTEEKIIPTAPGIQFLAKNFPVTLEELQAEIVKYQPKIDAIKLKTKALVTVKLLSIALAVRISQKKLLIQQKVDVCEFYGYTNRTIVKKSKRAHPQFAVQQPFEQTIIDLGDQPIERLSDSRHVEINVEEDSLLFYLFPVRRFQPSSRLFSMLVSFALNLGFGAVLSYCNGLTTTIKYGLFFQIPLGLLILPYPPKSSEHEFFNSMCFSTIWKYCVFGVVSCLWCAINSSFILPWTPFLATKIMPLIQSFLVVCVIVMFCQKSTFDARLLLLTILCLLAYLGLFYFSG